MSSQVKGEVGTVVDRGQLPRVWGQGVSVTAPLEQGAAWTNTSPGPAPGSQGVVEWKRWHLSRLSRAQSHRLSIPNGPFHRWPLCAQAGGRRWASPASRRRTP